MVRHIAITVLILTSIASVAQTKVSEPVPDSLKPILHAICMVESSGGKNKKDGDNLHAIGPYQIHKEYWYDATHDKKGNQIYSGTYEDCRNMAYAEQIVIRYWKRYCPEALIKVDTRTLAYTHHKGADNAEYYGRVKRFLK